MARQLSCFPLQIHALPLLLLLSIVWIPGSIYQYNVCRSHTRKNIPSLYEGASTVGRPTSLDTGRHQLDALLGGGLDADVLPHPDDRLYCFL